MTDARLRELERRFQESGSPEAEAAWLRERYRVLPTVALIACVHANLEALQAVLDDIDQRGVKRIVCLGDVVGYGPNPVECVDLVQARCEAAVRGHADHAVITGDLHAWGPASARSIRWSRRLLRPGWRARPAAQRRWKQLCALPQVHLLDDALCVHGSPRDPLFENLLPLELLGGFQDATRTKYDEVFAAFDRTLFVAHTHYPGVITEERVFRTPVELDGAYALPPEQKSIVNPGSVGQPRDRDPRAGYAIVSGDLVRWHRVGYDIERTVAKITAQPEVHPSLGERLRRGI